MQVRNQPRTATLRWNHLWNHFSPRRLLAGSLLLTAAAIGGIQPALAEGSRELTSNGGDRPYIDFFNNTTSGTSIPRRTVIKVFTNTGEFLNLGSSAVGIGAGVINYRAPNGTAGSCGTGVGGGLIANQAQEAAGPGAAGGFTPCSFVSTQTGIWEIDFVSPDPNGGNDPTRIGATTAWTQGASSRSIAAWDVTVSTGGALGAGGVATTGRVYANYFALNMGGIAAGPSLNSVAYVLTPEGYQYRVNLNGIDPFGFLFFANARGFTRTSPAGDPSYTSVPFLPALPANITPLNPAFVSQDSTHKLFINPPSSALPTNASSASGATFLLNPALPTPSVGGLTFTGAEGTVNQLGGSPLGGNFTFNTTTAGSYSLVLDIDRNGVFGDNNDRVLLGAAAVGAVTVPWDGLDGNGAAVAGNTTYRARVSVSVGEAHFPFLDVENAPAGITVERLNGVGCPGAGCSTLFYNDRLVDPTLGVARLPNTGATAHPFPGPLGTDSNSGFGNDRGIDTWINVSTNPAAAEATLFVRRADLKVTKVFSPPNPVPGGPITYTITVRNAGPSDVVQVGVNDTVPPTISNVTWSCAITTGVGTCANPSGVGNSINTNVSFLSNGAIATYTVVGRINPTATGSLSNTATITRPADVNDPVDDDNSGGTNTTESASATFTLGPPLPLIGLAKQVGTPIDNGNGTFTLPYTFRLTNLGPIDLINVQATEDLSSVYTPAGFTIAAPPTGTGITGNPSFTGTGVGININLLAAGQTLAIGATATVTLNVIVTPNGNFGPYTNTARATATDANGNPTADDSNDGTNADPDNDGDPTNNSTPTRVSIPNSSVLPKLGVAKQVGAPTINDDGSYTVPYTVLVRNFGTVPVNQVQLTEDLFGTPTSTFNGATSAVVSVLPTVSGSLTAANPNFNGNSDKNLLSGTQSLPPGQSATVLFTVRVVPGNSTGPYLNTVIANGVGPNGQPLPPQRSVDQTGIPNPNPDLNGDGDPSNDGNTPTRLTFGPRFRILKRITSATRSGSAIPGVNFGAVSADAEGITTALGSAGLPPIGVPSIPPTNPLASGDEVEYTIYFLSDGGTPAIDTNLCDQIPIQATLIADTNRLKLGSADLVRGGSVFSPIAPLPLNNSCSDQSNPNGSVIFNLGNVPSLRGSNAGFARFRVRIN